MGGFGAEFVSEDADFNKEFEATGCNVSLIVYIGMGDPSNYFLSISG